MAYARAPDFALKIGPWSFFCFCGAAEFTEPEIEQLEDDRAFEPLERPCSLNNLHELGDEEQGQLADALPNFSGEWLLVKAEGDWDSFLKEMDVGYMHARPFARSSWSSIPLSTAVISLSAAISACERGQQWPVALQLFDTFRSAAVQLDLIACNSVVSACEKGGQWQAALHLLQDALCPKNGGSTTVQEHDLQLDAISFNAAISACAKSTTWPWALQLLDDLQASKLESDTVSFNAAISAAEDWQMAFHLLDHMDQVQVQRDVVSFNAAISASDWHHSLLLLERMRFLSIPPQLITCSTAITSCSLGGRWQDALHLFESIQQPDLIAFNALISACEKGSAWEAALQLLRSLPEMSSGKLRANLITCNSALSACEKSQQWQQAISILAQLPEKDGISFNACISACGRASQWQGALQLLSQASAEGLADVVTCAASVNACSEAGLWQQALLIFFQMRAVVGTNAGVVTYGAAVSASAVGFQWQLALALLWECCMLHQCFSVVLFNACIAVCESCRRWEVALDLWQELRLRGGLEHLAQLHFRQNRTTLTLNGCLEEDAMTFSGLISSCSVCEQWALAMELVQEVFAADNVQPDVIVYNTAIGACSESGSWQLALAILERLQTATVRADVPTYNAAISACETCNNRCQPLSLAFLSSIKPSVKYLKTSSAKSLSKKLRFISRTRTMVQAMGYGVGVMKQIVEHKSNEMKVTLISPKGTSTSTIVINGVEQESVDPMDGKKVKVVPCWRGNALEVKSRWADTLKELPVNRRFLKGPQMIIESTTASGLVVKRVFEAKEKGRATRNLVLTSVI
eukprot:s812_g1.t1